MQELERTQLVNVRRVNILVDQILLFTFGSVIWIAGLLWLLRPGNANKFQGFRLYLPVCSRDFPSLAR